MEDKVKFESKVGEMGGSLRTTIPQQICQYLNIKDGDTIIMIGDTSKHGKHAAFWKKTNK